jgi:hypothetical protein
MPQEPKRIKITDAHRREYYCEECGVEEACNSAYLGEHVVYDP